MKPRKIIDAHTHIFPDRIAVRAADSVGQFYDRTTYYYGFPHTLVEEGKKAGICKFLVCSVATNPHQVSSINDFLLEEAKTYKEFFALAGQHPKMEHLQAEKERIAQLNYGGIKLHPDFQTFNIDDENMIPLYKKAAQLKLPILFHMGDARYDYSSPHRLYNALQHVPDLTCIAAHFGGYERWEEAYRYLKADNIYFDTSSSIYLLGKEHAVAMIKHFGADHFMFGTDFPMWEFNNEIKLFTDLALSEQDEDQIFYKTFETLFHITVEE